MTVHYWKITNKKDEETFVKYFTDRGYNDDRYFRSRPKVFICVHLDNNNIFYSRWRHFEDLEGPLIENTSQIFKGFYTIGEGEL